MNETQPDAAPSPCPNCGDPTPGNYCPNCGQRRGDRRVTLRRLIADAVEDQFSLNGTLARTLGVLLTRPGRLTSDYVAGRISRYVPPFRLYLLTSFLFFLAVNLLDRGTFNVVETNETAADSAIVAPPQDSAAVRAAADSSAQALQRVAAVADSLFRDDGRFGSLPRWLRERARDRIVLFSMTDMADVNAMFRREMTDRLPLAVFLLLPLFAGLLALLYVRRRRYYVEHFVFALHIHAFVFLMFTLLQLIERWTWPSRIVGIWLTVYLFLALKRFYAQSVPKTLLKFVVLGGMYGTLLVGAVLVLVALVLLTAPL